MKRIGLVLLWAGAVWLCAQNKPLAPLSALLVIPVLSFFPGWLLLRALRIELRGLEILLFSIALSWAILIACGFALNPFGALDETGWLIATGGAMALLAWLAPAGSAKRLRLLSYRPHIDVIALSGFVLALVLTIGSVGLAAWQEHFYRPFEVLELWMRLRNGAAELRVGLHNGDLQERVVRLEIRGERRLIHVGTPMILKPGQTVTRSFIIPPTPEQAPERIEALLFDTENRVLRRTHVTIGDVLAAGRIEKEPDE